MSKAVEKRNFCFVLAPSEGNAVAQRLGFPMSSEEVTEMEVRDAKVKLGFLLGTGVYPHIHEVGSWMADVYKTSNPQMSSTEHNDAEHIFTAYGSALITHLLDKGVLIFSEACFDPNEASKE